VSSQAIKNIGTFQKLLELALPLCQHEHGKARSYTKLPQTTMFNVLWKSCQCKHGKARNSTKHPQTTTLTVVPGAMPMVGQSPNPAALSLYGTDGL
jgi:hypothetical protein